MEVPGRMSLVFDTFQIVSWEQLDLILLQQLKTSRIGYIFDKWLTDDKLSVQVVVRELLAQYTKQYEKRPLSSLLQNWAELGSDKLRTR